MRLNQYQWDSAGRGMARGLTEGVGAERFHGGVSIRVTVGGTYMGIDLTTEQADDLAKFLIDHGIAERASQRPTVTCAVNHGPGGCPGYPHPTNDQQTKQEQPCPTTTS